MEDQIRDKVVCAYGGVVLEEELKRQAKRNILEKAQRGGRRKFIYGVVAAAAVVIFVLGNMMLIRFNLRHGENVPIMETTSSAEEETTGNIQAKALGDIQTLTELEELSFAANSYVWNLENNFFVAILCFDENGEACLPKSNMTARIEYAYFLFDESGVKLKEWQENFDIESKEYQSIGAVFLNGDWYEVRDSKKNGSEHYYEVYNVTSPEKSSYARHPEDEETVYRISSNTYYFARYAEDGNGYMKVGVLDNEYYGQIPDFTGVNSRQDIEQLIAQPEVYSIKLLNDLYFVVLPYRENRRCSLNDQADRFDIGCYKTENDEIAGYWESLREAENSVVEYIGVSNYDGDFYLISKEKDTEKYRITALLWNFEECLYCDEGICPEVYSNAIFFARLVTEGETSYWQFGENIRRETDYSPEVYCKKHDWDEQCTSDMTVRDIYVTKNWIGESALKFKGLEPFFDEPVQTEFVTGDKSGLEGSENAYQVDYHFTCLNFHVSTEANSDEIISVTLFGNHNLYVTEDIWLGMSMEEVKSKMGIGDNAFFEHEGFMYSYFEKDGFLYEFVYMEEPVGENLPPYASYPKPDYVLNYAKISDADKITASPVKSLGELMFGDYHSLEEGKSIYGDDF